MDATTKLGTPALVAFVAGRNADQWMAKSKSEQEAAMLNQLESYFGPKIRTEFVDFFIKDWQNEPSARGGPVNYLPPGHMHNFHALRTPFNCIHFAGTATSVEWPGYFSGAVQSGKRAVAEILAAIEPTALQACMCTGREKRPSLLRLGSNPLPPLEREGVQSPHL